MSRKISKWIGILLVGSIAFSFLSLAAFAQLGAGKKPPVERTIEIKCPVYFGFELKDLPPYRQLLDTLYSYGPRGNTSLWYMGWLYSMRAFEVAYPSIRIIPVNDPWWDTEAAERLMTNLAGGTAPAYYPVNLLGGLRTAASKGLVADITDLVKQWPVAKNFSEKTLAVMKYKGRYYGIPMFRGGWDVGLAYRKDYCKEAGIFDEKGNPGPSTNWTITDFIDICQKLTNPKKKIYGTVIPLHKGSSDWYSRLWEFSYLVPFALPDPTGKNTYISALNTQQSKRLLQLNHDLVWKYKCATYGTEIENWGAALQLFKDGKIATTITWSGPSFLARHCSAKTVEEAGGMVATTIKDGKEVLVPYSEVIGGAPLPKGPQGTRTNAIRPPDLYGINPLMSKEQIWAAFEWLNWMNAVMGWEMQMRVDVDRRLTRKLMNQRGVKLPEKRLEFSLNCPTMYPVSGAKSWLEQMEINNPSTARARRAILADPSAPLPEVYGLSIPNRSSYFDIVKMAVSEAVTKEDADIDAIADKYAQMANRGPFKFKDKEITKENWKEYWTDFAEFCQKNFPEYYEKVLMGELWKKVKVW